MLGRLRARGHDMVDKLGAAPRIELQFLAALDQAAEVLVHLFHLFADHRQLAQRSPFGQLEHQDAGRKGDAEDQEQLPRDPGDVAEAGRQHDQVAESHRERLQSEHEHVDVARQDRLQAGLADLLQLGVGRGQQLVADRHAGLEDRLLGQVQHQHFGGRLGHQLQQADAEEQRAHQLPGRPCLGHALADDDRQRRAADPGHDA
ncbi:hypothetical protein LP419_12655 [Massilia sp. H-1]|nr:hypothetical protein LP419_12655 [Massilia sp. H-1]